MNRHVCSVFAIVLAVLVIGCAKNKPPEIVAVKAFQTEIGPGDSVDIIATATDPENGRVKYKWTVKDGKLSSDKDSAVRWYAPEKPGTYKITVKATDPKMAATSKTIDLKVLKAAVVFTGSLGSGDDYTKPGKVDKPARPGRKAQAPAPSDGGGKKRGKRGTKG
jgi:hypothetical protein